MSPAEPLPPGAPPATPANHIGEKVLSALDGFVQMGNDLRRDITDARSEIVKLGEAHEKPRSDVMDIKIANASILAGIAGVKESLERNNSKIDHLEEKTSDRFHQLDDRASDMKSNITALGVNDEH